MASTIGSREWNSPGVGDVRRRQRIGDASPFGAKVIRIAFQTFLNERGGERQSGFSVSGDRKLCWFLAEAGGGRLAVHCTEVDRIPFSGL
jgi:hypothetical protein